MDYQISQTVVQDESKSTNIIRYGEYVEITQQNFKKRFEFPIQDHEKIFIFDLDLCLYTHSTLIEEERAIMYQKYVQISKNNDKNTYELAKQNYSSEYEFLYKEHGILPEKITQWKLEHLKLENVLTKDQNVIDKLVWLKNQKYRLFLFSNGLKKRIEHICKLLGIDNLFEAYICFSSNAIDFIGKPHKLSYLFVQTILQIKNLKNIHFFDDQISNIQSAQLAGWNGYHVQQNILEAINTAIDAINKQ